MLRVRSLVASFSASLATFAAPALVALSLALLAACPSSSPAKGSQVPSEMLGPSTSSASSSTSSSSSSAATPAEPSALDQPSGEESSGTASGSDSSSPAAPAAPLSAAEQKTFDEMKGLMREVTVQFERLVGALEQSGADCKKAASALSTSQKGSAAVDKKMTAFKAKLQAGPQPSPELMAQLREITLAAFPADVRARAETTFDRLEKQCANDPDFQRAKSEAAAQGPS